MVVSCAIVGIGDQTISLAADHGTDFGVCFEVHKTVNHMGAGPFKPARLPNIGSLIKPSFQFHQSGDRFPVFCRFAQRFHNG